MTDYQARDRVFQNIDHERNQQDRKWGVQHHPDGTDSDHAGRRDFYRQRCEDRAAFGEASWLDILLEETFEAAAEQDQSSLRKELVQTAAVIVAWIEDIDDRRNWHRSPR